MRDFHFSSLILHPLALRLANQVRAVDPADGDPAATAFDADARPFARIFVDPDARAVAKLADDATFPSADVEIAVAVG